METTTDSQEPQTATATMQAITQHEYGGVGTLSLEEVPVPGVGATEVLIEVHAAGVDRGVWHLMTGEPYLVRLAGYGIRRPKTPVLGLDVAGVVVSVGADVERFSVGDEVFGIARGAYAEYAVADAAKLSRKPTSTSFEEAAASAVSGITALQALSGAASLEAGQTVLVIGASGGVGSFAVQIARALGGRVTGVASQAKADLVASLGADRVIDYAREDYLDGRHTYDVIIDTGGRNPVRKLRRALNRNGTLVIVGGEGGGRWTGGIGRQVRATMLSPFVPQKLVMLMSKEQHTSMDRLGEMLATGQITAAVGERYSLAETANAIRDLEGGKAAGKSVIVVRGRNHGA